MYLKHYFFFFFHLKQEVSFPFIFIGDACLFCCVNLFSNKFGSASYPLFFFNSSSFFILAFSKSNSSFSKGFALSKFHFNIFLSDCPLCKFLNIGSHDRIFCGESEDKIEQ